MKVELKQLNALPMPTWRWLGVNCTQFAGEVPAIRPLAGNTAPALPPGAQPLAQDEMAALGNIPTGMGENMALFTEEWQNTAFTACVPAGQAACTPVVLRHHAAEENPAIVAHNAIVAEENSRLVVVQHITGDDTTHAFVADTTRIHAQKGAAVLFVSVQTLNGHSVHLGNIGVQAEAGATVDVVQIELGAGQTFAGCRARLCGRKARVNTDTAYFADGTRTMDFNYFTEHLAPETYCNMRAGGALFHQSEKVFRGTIDFVKGAARSIGHEQETTLLFSKTARARSAPLILCGEENVEGQHAATIGKIDAEKLFYLQTRGLSEAAAKKLMVEAQFAPTLAKLPDDNMREAVRSYLTERMQGI